MESEGETQDTTNSELTKKKKLTFSTPEDISLLREVYCSRPFDGSYKEVPQKWAKVVKNLAWDRTIVSVRARFELLLKKFKSDERESLRASGTEEDYDEKIQLLQDISDLMSTSIETKEKNKVAESEKEKLKIKNAQEVRAAAMEGLRTGHCLQGRPSNRSYDDKLIAAYQERHAAELAARAEELDFKKKKLDTMIIERAEDRKVELRRIEMQEKAQQDQSKLLFELVKRLGNN